ncbi:hypothetical protein [Shewanella surugensis]|uniref:Uncharacterized protein n=1 Tax=Shewanella surugensis TaxID=212020 RepID=A0ABT0LCW7_9GAMM|nr:hypothetical protein [Shewanella surugensis]MCL1125551.1 hypothetical protein [Shewanella surugensis]
MGMGLGNPSDINISYDFAQENVTNNEAVGFHFRVPTLLNVAAPFCQWPQMMDLMIKNNQSCEAL